MRNSAQCPSCEHEAPQAEFGEPLRCPKCGAYYDKALKMKLSAALASSATPVAEPAPAKKPAFTLAADHVAVATRGLDGAQPVVVVDVQMRFWSMVVFIIKWALASIPALLILMMFFAGVVSFMGGLLGTALK